MESSESTTLRDELLKLKDSVHKAVEHEKMLGKCVLEQSAIFTKLVNDIVRQMNLSIDTGFALDRGIISKILEDAIDNQRIALSPLSQR